MTSFPSQLIAGYRSFRKNRLPEDSARYRILAEAGQRPQTLVIACCDSRSAPEQIFDASPGELFVIRNVSSLVPPYDPDGHHHGTSAAIEFAIKQLHIRHIVVMGHGRCGGITAWLNRPSDPSDFLAQWISLIDPAAEGLDPSLDAKARQKALEFASIRHSIEMLKSFPVIASLASIGEVELHGAWFDISTGELYVLDESRESFEKID
jgi:carbonic anhydrase